METVHIVGALRTPYAKFCGAYQNVEGINLFVYLLNKALAQTGVPANAVDRLYLGNCGQSETKDASSPSVARQVVLKSDLPNTVVSATVDKACCSGIDVIKRGMDVIRLGEADVVVAGGLEMMDRVPFMVRGVRGHRGLADLKLEDPMLGLGYHDYAPVALDAGNVAVKNGVGREEQDAWALRSQQTYQAALAAGKIAEELVPVRELAATRGKPVTLEGDEAPRPDVTLEKLAALPTVYGSPTITAGNAPGLNSGAALVILMSDKKRRELGLDSMAEIILADAIAAEDPALIPEVPAGVIRQMLDKTGLSLDDLQCIEINEAFAAMPLVSTKILAGGDDALMQRLRDITNVNGGAVAIGHPTGSTGCRIAGAVVRELRRRGGGYGVAVICGGLAQGDGILVKV